MTLSFPGKEVEKPAYGKRTLFVVGIHDTNKIEKMYSDNNCEHILFGANPVYRITVWKNGKIIRYFLKKDILCSLDIPMNIQKLPRRRFD